MNDNTLQQRLTLINSLGYNPDDFAYKTKIAQSMSLPVGLVNQNDQQQYQANNIMRSIDGRPILQNRIDNNNAFVKMSHDDFDNLASIEHLATLKRTREYHQYVQERKETDPGILKEKWNSLAAGFRQFSNSIDAWQAKRWEKKIEALDNKTHSGFSRLWTLEQQAKSLGGEEKLGEKEYRELRHERNRMERLRAVWEENRQREIKEYAEDIEATKPQLSLASEQKQQELAKSEGLAKAWQFVTSPNTMANTIAQSFGTYAPALAGTVVASVTTGGLGAIPSLGISAGVSGAGGYLTESLTGFSDKVEERMQKTGAAADEAAAVEALQEIFTDKEFLQEAERYAQRRGLAIGGVNALSLGTAGALKGMLQGAGRAKAATAAALGADTLGEGLGEGLAQHLSTGKVDIGDVLIEMIAGAGTNLGEVISLGSAPLKNYLSGRQQEQLEDLGQLWETAKGSKLRQRSAEEFNQFVRELEEESDIGEIYLDGKALHQSGLDGQLAEAAPHLGVEEAVTTGGAVRVPLTDYLEHIAPNEELVAGLKDHIRFGAEQLSAQELAESAEGEIREALESSLKRMAQAEQRESQLKVISDQIKGQLRNTGRFADNAIKPQVDLATARYDALADMLEISPEEAYARYPVRIVGAYSGQQQQLAQARRLQTQQSYEARIDELFAGAEASTGSGVTVLDRSDILDLLGYGDTPVILVEGKVKAGIDNHPNMTAEIWKKVPEWIENPALVFDSDTQHSRLVAIAPETVEGNPVRIILSPTRDGLEASVLINAYDADTQSPHARWAEEGLLRYADTKKAPQVDERFGRRLPDVLKNPNYHPSAQIHSMGRGKQQLAGRTKILTEKNLAGYRKNAPVLEQRAWHGSAYRGIEKTVFKLHKIGTGEGAQVYGWGMYFASKQEVAEWYRKKLTVEDEYVDGELLDTDIPRHMLASTLDEAKHSYLEESKVVDEARKNLQFLALRGYYPRIREAAKEALMLLDKGERPVVERIKPDGQLYSVEIPEDEDLLDWDNAISKQPAKVKRQISELLDALPAEQLPTIGIADKAELARAVQNMNGKIFYATLEKLLGDQQLASERLLQHGIPGLRYLDRDSRAHGQGSHNFVIWDEALLTPKESQIATYYQSAADNSGALSPASDNILYQDAIDDTRIRRNLAIVKTRIETEQNTLARLKREKHQLDQAPVDEALKEENIKAAERRTKLAGGEGYTGTLYGFYNPLNKAVMYYTDLKIAELKASRSAPNAEIQTLTLEQAQQKRAAEREKLEEAITASSKKLQQAKEEEKDLVRELEKIAAGQAMGDYRPQGLYSALQREVESIQMKSGTAASWEQQLDGLVSKGKIKEEEIYWSGLREWLELQEGKITRESVQSYLNGHRGTFLQERTYRGVWLVDKGDGDIHTFARKEDAEKEYRDYLQWIEEAAEVKEEEGALLLWTEWGEEQRRIEPNENGQWTDEEGQSYASKEEALEDLEEQAEEIKQYYREKVQQPSFADKQSGKEGEAKYGDYSYGAKGDNYRELVLSAIGDKTGAYRTSHWDEKNAIAHIRLTDFDNGETLFVEELQSDWAQEKRKGKTEEKAPFVDSTGKWLNLTLKRVLLEAARGGYKRVAFINGKQSNERYALHNLYNKIEYDGKTLTGSKKEGGETVQYQIPPQQLGEAIGEDLAEKLLAQKNEDGIMRLEGEEIKIDKEGMLGFYDKIVPQAVKELLKKLDKNITIENIAQAETGGTQMSFQVSDKMRQTLVEKGLPLYQENNETKTSPRGAYLPDERTIVLLEKADLTTFTHELGHLFTEDLMNIAADLRDTAALAGGGILTEKENKILKDADTLLKWFDPNLALDTWHRMNLEEKRNWHEQAARGFEAFVMEGKAPSLELQSVFSRMRRWFYLLYKKLAKLDVKLNDDVRAVYGRMIASEESIQLAEQNRSMMQLFANAETAGMSEEEFAAYQATTSQASEKARDEHLTKTMKDIKYIRRLKKKTLREKQKEADDIRAEAEERAQEIVASQPIYRAWQILTAKSANHALRLDRSILEEMGYGVDEIDSLGKKSVKKGGVHPDLIAELILDEDGNKVYKSGDELVKTLLDSPSPKEAIANMADEIMLADYGEMYTPEAMSEAADMAVHNEYRLRVLATEYRALTKTIGSIALLNNAASQLANKIISGQRLKNIKPNQYARMEAKAAKASEIAFAKGDIETAAAEKKNQILQAHLTRAAYKAKEKEDKHVRYLKGLRKLNPKTIIIEHREQIESILERYGFGSRKPAQRQQTLAEWVEQQREIGFDPDIAPHLLDETQRTTWKDLTFEELQDVVDAVKHLEHAGKAEKRLLTSAKKEEISKKIEEMALQAQESAGTKPRNDRIPTTTMGKIKLWARDMLAQNRRASMIMRALDGDKDGGVIVSTLGYSANKAGDLEAQMNAHATEAMSKTLSPVFKRLSPRENNYTIAGEERRFSDRDIFAMALNWGNDGNKQRLLDGEGWKEEDIRILFARLGKEDWQAVQKVWDYYRDHTKEQVGRIHRDINGVELQWVEQMPFEVITKEGEAIKLEGGYYPIKYDPLRSPAAQQQQDIDAKSSYSATVRDSFTKARSSQVKGRPLRYDLAGIYQGLSDTIHYIAWKKWTIDANRLLADNEFTRTVQRMHGAETLQQLRDWRNSISSGGAQEKEGGIQFLTTLRHNIALANLGYNSMTAAVQLTGILQTMTRVGYIDTAITALRYLTRPLAMTIEARENSLLMQNRNRTWFRELNELRNTLGKKSAIQEVISKYGFWALLKMQGAVDTITWHAQYNKSLGNGAAPEMAAQEADQTVRDTQGSGMLNDLSAAERGGEIKKLLTVHYSFMNTIFNLNYNTINSKSLNWAGKMGHLFTLNIGLVIVEEALRSLLTPGEDDKWSEEKMAATLGKELLSFQFGQFIGLREIPQMMSNYSYKGPTGVAPLANIADLSKQISQGEIDDGFLRALLQTVGTTFGLPSAQVNRTLKGLRALEEGDTDNPGALLFGHQK